MKGNILLTRFQKIYRKEGYQLDTQDLNLLRICGHQFYKTKIRRKKKNSKRKKENQKKY